MEEPQPRLINHLKHPKAIFRRPNHPKDERQNRQRLWTWACNEPGCKTPCRHVQPAFENGIGGYDTEYLSQDMLPETEQVIITGNR